MKTKKIFLLLAGLTISIFTLRAQDIVGIKGGLNFARLSGFNSGDDRVSLHAGFFLHHTINSHVCFQPELLYSGEGQRYFDTNGDERTIALEYVQLPLMIQYFPIRQFYLEAGPQFGILASAQDKGPGENLNVKSSFATGQIAIGLGAGIYINRQVGLYARYNFGLNDVSKFDNIVDHSNVGQIGMAFRIE